MQGDGAAIARARARDQDAFRELVERHSRNVFRLAYRMTANEQDAEEVVQETFLHAWRRLDRFEGRAGLGTWLYRIAANCALDLLRLRQRRAEDAAETLAATPGLDAGPERLAASAEANMHVRAAMAGLTPSERAAFVLRHFAGMRTEEIARNLGRSPEATRNAVFRAVQKLRRALGVYAASL